MAAYPKRYIKFSNTSLTGRDFILVLRRKSEPVTKRVVICDATRMRENVKFIYIMSQEFLFL